MYNNHFGLYTDPFPLTPELRFVYPSGAFEETMSHLLYGLEGGEDIIQITGRIGTGKTLALHSLIKNVSSAYRVVFVNVTQLDQIELLKLILLELDVQVPAGCDRADFVKLFKDAALAARRDGGRILLVIDEAQNLPPDAIESLRLLTNVGQPDGQAVQIILSGQPGLRSLLDLPELVQVKQRIRIVYDLDTLTRQETEEYIDHRMRVAGCDQPVFAKGAIDQIFAASGGVPRLINILGDRALLSAYVDGKKRVSVEHVEDEGIVPSPDLPAAAAPALAAAKPSEKTTASAPEPAPEPTPTPAPKPAPESERPVPWPSAVPGGGGAGRVLGVSAVILVLAAAAWFFRAEIADLYAGLRGPAPVAVQTVPDIPSDVVPEDEASPEAVAEAGEAASEETAAQTPADVPGEDEAEIVAATTAESPPAAVAAPVPLAPGFYIHVGSFLDRARAEAFRQRLAAADHPTEIRDRIVDDSLWHRVYVGPFADLDAARAAELVLKREHAITYTMIHEIG